MRPLRTLANLLSVALVASWSSSLAASDSLQTRAGIPNYSFDGRFGTQCDNRVRDAGQEYCFVSLYRLVAMPEKYDGQNIGVIGFLISVFDKPMLFPSRDSYESNVPGEAVFINGPIPPAIRKSLRTGISPALVVGKFDAKFIGPGFPALGEIRDVQRVAEFPRGPGMVKR